MFSGLALVWFWGFLLLLEGLEGLEYPEMNFVLDCAFDLLPSVVVFHYGEFVRGHDYQCATYLCQFLTKIVQHCLLDQVQGVRDDNCVVLLSL